MQLNWLDDETPTPETLSGGFPEKMVLLDLETTGGKATHHRIIEIGALELMHHLPTGRKLHLYINPERDIDDGAVAVHGITNDFLADKPVFADIGDDFNINPNLKVID